VDRAGEGKDDQREQSPWQRFLKGKTGPQRLVLAVGALAAAVLAIGGVVAAVVRFVDADDDRRVGPATDDVQRIENQSAEADDLVKLLIEHDERSPIQLNHQVIAPRGPNDVSLQYACDEPTGCSVVRLQLPDSTANEIPNGLWFQGCYLVVMNGAGYGAQPLDLALHLRGETCAD
jgi:hypothetical protein